MLISKLKQLSSDRFIRNVGWLGGAELVNRVFRLGTTVTLAHLFSAHDYGLVAVIYTTYDLTNTFTLSYGIGSKIIQADEQDIETICNTAYWLNWILCGTLFIVQCVAAFAIAWFYKSNELILPICTVALIYLMLPTAMVHSALIQRENRLNVKAFCYATNSTLSNCLTITLALMGMGVWSIVWAMVLTTPVWLTIYYLNHPWRHPKSFKLERWQEITSYSQDLLGVELLSKLRSNLDYILIGRFLGIDALGIYYLAFNAGLGISQNVINTFTSALFPHLCEVRGSFNQLKQRYFSSLKKMAIFVVPLILLQSSLAPFYVPIIFGKKWVTAIPILVMICLSALPLPFYKATYLLLKAVGKTRSILYWDLIYTGVFASVLLVSVHWGIFWVAASVLIANGLAYSLYALWGSRYVLFSKKLILFRSEENL